MNDETYPALLRLVILPAGLLRLIPGRACPLPNDAFQSPTAFCSLGCDCLELIPANVCKVLVTNLLPYLPKHNGNKMPHPWITSHLAGFIFSDFHEIQVCRAYAPQT